MLALIAAAAAVTATASWAGGPSAGQTGSLILQAANAFRADNGLARLASDPALTADAQAFADYLARTGQFSHTAGGRDPGARAAAAGYDYCELAENIALEQGDSGASPERLVRLFMSGWEGSAGHRRNLLAPAVTQTGVGVARAPGFAQTYIAVQEFGRPVAARYSFDVDNRTDRPVGYIFEGEHRAAPPRSTTVHTTCAHGEIVFDAAAVSGESRYAAEPGAAYVLLSAPRGVQISVRRDPSGKRGGDRDLGE